jgi:hypothetical protein
MPASAGKRRAGRLELDPRFLHPILPNILESSVERREKDVERVSLRDRYDADLTGFSARSVACGDDRFADLGEALGEQGGFHVKL